MNTRWARVARGTLAACFAVFVAALFHSAMGGAVPSLLAVTLSLAFAVPACVVLSGRRISLWRQTLSVGLSQFMLHALFSLDPGGARFSPANGSAHVHAGSHLAMTGDTAGAAGHMAGMHASGLMWLGHASAVILTVAAMRYGELIVRQLLAAGSIPVLAFIKRIALVPVPTTAAALRTPDAQPVMLPAPRILIGRMRHRGPPARAISYA